MNITSNLCSRTLITNMCKRSTRFYQLSIKLMLAHANNMCKHNNILYERNVELVLAQDNNMCKRSSIFYERDIQFIIAHKNNMHILFPHLPGEGCSILSQLFSSSSSASYPPPAPPAPPAPPPPASPPPPLPPLPRPLLPCQLFANVRAQCAPLDLNLGPSQLSGHRWTSTWDLPSSVGTAGPQPGTCPAQCAPLDPAQCALLDLNLGPAQLSVHRWTSMAR